MSVSIPSSEMSTWLAALKPYQRMHIEKLIASTDSAESAADRWLDANGPDATVGFGGPVNPKPYRDLFKAELRRFVCGDSAYDAEREKLVGQVGGAEAALISAASAAVAVKIGVAATMLVPPVALMLHVIGKAGVKAWCAQAPETPGA